MIYNKSTIEEFIDLMSSTNPMPGGGVGVALVASIATSLTLKVCNLSIGKKKYKEYESLITESIHKLNDLKNTFFSLMDKDAEDFKNIERVFKLPKDTEMEKKKRDEELEKASKICCETPKILILKLKDLLKCIDSLDGKTSTLAHSDLVIAKILSNAAINSSFENININFENINDAKFKETLLENIK